MSLLALTLALAAPIQAVAAAPTVGLTDPARKARGIELARLLNSEALTRAQSDRMIDGTLAGALKADPTFKELEKDYPGISKAMLDAMRPIVIEETAKTLPVLWERIGAVYAEELTTAELDETIAFFQSPTGTRVLEGMAREADFGGLMQALLADEEAKLTETALRAGLAAGAVKTVKQLSVEDRNRIANFEWTPAGAKFGGTKARILPIITAWSNEASPEGDARMEAAMDAIVDKFISEDTPE